MITGAFYVQTSHGMKSLPCLEEAALIATARRELVRDSMGRRVKAWKVRAAHKRAIEGILNDTTRMEHVKECLIAEIRGEPKPTRTRKPIPVPEPRGGWLARVWKWLWSK